MLGLHCQREIDGLECRFEPTDVVELYVGKCIRSQGEVTCIVCALPYHLKCLGADFDYPSKCGFCSIAVRNTTEEEDLTEATLDFVTDLSIYQSTINLYSS